MNVARGVYAEFFRIQSHFVGKFWWKSADLDVKSIYTKKLLPQTPELLKNGALEAIFFI